MEAEILFKAEASRERRQRLSIDVTAATPSLGGPMHVVVELVLPVRGAPAALLVCLPGGAMNRRYFDLPTPPGEEEVSFARALAAEGFAVATVDPLGVGESTLPDDPYLLTVDVAAAATNLVARTLIDGLRQGSLVEGLGTLPKLRAIGVGHSFGAAVTLAQQAADPLYDAVALLGFHVRVTPPYPLREEDRGISAAEARTRLVELARRNVDAPAAFLDSAPSGRMVSAASAADRLLAGASVHAMVPDLLAPDAGAITVPVLIVLGDRDLHGPPHEAPKIYTASQDVTLLVLSATRHNHFIYPTRTALFGRIARWIRAL